MSKKTGATTDKPAVFDWPPSAEIAETLTQALWPGVRSDRDRLWQVLELLCAMCRVDVPERPAD
tara:strand:- start:1355 stop:1546 length:192 start_codon:yes stop_codon:yes gene_type:complete